MADGCGRVQNSWGTLNEITAEWWTPPRLYFTSVSRLLSNSNCCNFAVLAWKYWWFDRNLSQSSVKSWRDSLGGLRLRCICTFCVVSPLHYMFHMYRSRSRCKTDPRNKTRPQDSFCKRRPTHQMLSWWKTEKRCLLTSHTQRSLKEKAAATLRRSKMWTEMTMLCYQERLPTTSRVCPIPGCDRHTWVHICPVHMQYVPGWRTAVSDSDELFIIRTQRQHIIINSGIRHWLPVCASGKVVYDRRTWVIQ